MKKSFCIMVMFTAMFLACASDTEAEPTVHGNWLYVNETDTAGIGLTLNADGRYTALLLRLTSQTTGSTQVENGTYTATKDTLTFAPMESTCPDASAEVVSYKYTLSKDQLAVLFPEGIINLKKNDSKSETSFILTFGCFRDGKFTESSLAPIQ